MEETANTPLPKYRVFVDDNFHFMDEDERYEHGSYDTLEEAIAVSKGIVDEFLSAHHKPGMTAAELYAGYTGYGEDPFIQGPGSSCAFSAWNYAESRCAEICGPAPGMKQEPER